MSLRSLLVGTVTFATLFSAQVCLAQNRPSSCVTYEPSTVRLSGTLIRKTFAGPPNYESIRKGDKPETYLLLETSAPVCVDEDKENPDLNPSQEDVRKVQLVFQPKAYKKYGELVGKAVVATGTLFGAHTAHHHTPVLLTVKNIEETRP